MSEAGTGEYRTILGIRFFAGPADEAVKLGLRGGLVVAPAAPLLVEMVKDEQTRTALQRSRLALTDSGFMVLLWNLLRRDHVRRVSGLEYLSLLLRAPEVREPGTMFWIMPTETARERCRAWLEERNFTVARDDFYVAPFYGRAPIRDEPLLETISRRRPNHVFIALGGGVQERLGLYLQENLPYLPGIHCNGAAIGFLSGDQVFIPMWADRLRLGWLFRLVSSPRRFFPRYVRAHLLLPLLLKYGARSPVETPAGQ